MSIFVPPFEILCIAFSSISCVFYFKRALEIPFSLGQIDAYPRCHRREGVPSKMESENFVKSTKKFAIFFFAKMDSIQKKRYFFVRFLNTWMLASSFALPCAQKPSIFHSTK
jgi:hypothetical protein